MIQSLKYFTHELKLLFKGSYILLACCGIVLVYFLNSGIQDLYADEPTRALCSLEMILSGKWYPTINGLPYLNKPPLYNWILLPFLKFFGLSETVVRFPAIISMLGLGWLVFYFVNKFLKNWEVAFFSAFALLTSGNILFYSSLLGHIDALFAITVFALFMYSYKYGLNRNWNQLFKVTYFFCLLGFMLKGLPAIVFQGITLLVTLWHFNGLKQLFSKAHVLGVLVFIIPVSIYLAAFYQVFPLDSFIDNLWQESSKRTVVNKSLGESFKHFWYFPIQLFIDTAPWSFITLLFLNRKARLLIGQNTFILFGIRLFIANIIVYWLAPDNRARYIIMLYPLLLTAAFYVFFKLLPTKPVAFLNGFYSFIVLLFPLLILGVFIYKHEILVDYLPILVLLAGGGFYLAFKVVKDRKEGLKAMLFLLIGLRFGFDLIVLPERVKQPENGQIKKEANSICALARGKSLSLYCSNLPHSSTFYITKLRREILEIKNTPAQFQKGEYYLLPTDLITDYNKAIIHFEFIREFEQKPFSLATFPEKLPLPIKQ